MKLTKILRTDSVRQLARTAKGEKLPDQMA